MSAPAAADAISRQADRDRIVSALRSVAADIGEAGALLRLGGAACEADVERLTRSLRDKRAWLHFHADRLAAVSREKLG